MKRSYEIWDVCKNRKSCRVMQNVLTSFGSIINHMWCFAQFGTICTNLKKHEKFPRRSVTFIKAADFTLQLY